MGECDIANIIGWLVTVGIIDSALVLFESQKGSEIHSKEISWNLFSQANRVTSLAYRTPVRPRLVGFFVSVLVLFESQKGAKFIQRKFHGTCLVKQTDLYRPHWCEMASVSVV